MDNDIIRINGYRDGKRKHIDLKTEMEVTVYGSEKHSKFILPCKPTQEWLCDYAYSHGIDVITSFNIYDYTGRERLTVKTL